MIKLLQSVYVYVQCVHWHCRITAKQKRMKTLLLRSPRHLCCQSCGILTQSSENHEMWGEYKVAGASIILNKSFKTCNHRKRSVQNLYSCLNIMFNLCSGDNNVAASLKCLHVYHAGTSGKVQGVTKCITWGFWSSALLMLIICSAMHGLFSLSQSTRKFGK